MKIITVVGTRPELIRLSLIIPQLDKLCTHVLVHTNQNYDHSLNRVFLDELNIREPDYLLKCRADTAMKQIGHILVQCEEVFKKEKPDRILILGDTNSALSSLVAKRMGIKVYHMEAGNRCYDDRVPEEVNRRVIDSTSDVLLPYTEGSRSNLLREGYANHRIFVTGNPIKEVLDHFQTKIEASKALSNLKLQPKNYFLVTLHRQENVDIPERFDSFLEAFRQLYIKYKIPVICSTHPRTKNKLTQLGSKNMDAGIQFCEPFGLFDFISLEKSARCVLTDSGTVQEECAIFNIPNVTLRDVTERPETRETGSNMISGCDPQSILMCVDTVLSQPCDWSAPPDYMVKNVSRTVIKCVLSYSS